MGNSWVAKWIWGRVPEGNGNAYVEARKPFTLEAAPHEATVRISANQEYELYVNGAKVGKGPAPADMAWKYCDRYDVAPLLRAGPNVIAAVAYNFGDNVPIVTRQRQGPGGLIVQLDMATGSGALSIATDRTWKARLSPRWVRNVSRMHQWGGFKEIYLCAGEDGWELPGYADTAWEEAVELAGAEQPDSHWPRLLAPEIPPLRIGRVRPAAIVRVEPNYGRVLGAERFVVGGERVEAGQDESGAAGAMMIDATAPMSLPEIVYDFGAVKAGYPELIVEAPEGGVVQLSYGESLELALHDTFVLKPGANRLRPFGRRAFRYLGVRAQATPQPIAVEKLHMDFVHYDYAAEGSFACDNELLNRIWEVGKYTVLVNSQHHLEDCPYREGALWVVDAVVMAKVVYHVFGDTALVRKCLLQGARIQNADGSIPGTGPERNDHLLPDFCAHWFFLVRDYVAYSNDLGLLREVWPAMKRLLDWFARQEDGSGLFAGADRPGWWCFIDWADYIDKRDRVTAVSCFYYRVLREAEKLAELMGESRFAGTCAARAGRLRAAIRSGMSRPGGWLLADCLTDEGVSASVTLQTNFAAAWSGVLEREEIGELAQTMLSSREFAPIKGAFFYHIVLETLLEHGYVGQAVSIVKRFWGSMLARGATTWWETFDPTTPACKVPSPYQGNTPTYLSDHIPVSFCHGWGAGPTYWLTMAAAGIDVRELGGGKVRLDPRGAGLAWAKGKVPTPLGMVRAQWERLDDGLAAQFRAELPAGLDWISGVLEHTVVDRREDGTTVVRGVFRLTDCSPADLPGAP